MDPELRKSVDPNPDPHPYPGKSKSHPKKYGIKIWIKVLSGGLEYILLILEVLK
jgi:hypothetical protein